MPSRLRVRVPLTVSVRGQPGEDQRAGRAPRIAEVARRALLQGRRQALRSGLDLAADPSCPLSLELPVAGADGGGGGAAGGPAPDGLRAAVEDAARRGIGLAVARLDSGPDTLLPLATPDQAGQDGLTSFGAGRAEDPPQLAVFDSGATLAAYATMYFSEQTLPPRGNLRTGVYGFWAEDMRPYVFWVSGQVQEGVERGQLLWHATSLVHGERQGGRFVPGGGGNVPAAVELGGRYRLTVGATPPATRRGGRRRAPPPAAAELRREGAGRGRQVYLASSDLRALRGLQVRFAVAFAEVIEVTAVRPEPPVLPTAEELERRRSAWEFLWGRRALPAEPQGEPDWLWEWFGWLNVQPAEVRANRFLREVLADWERRGFRDQLRSTSALTIRVWRQPLYKNFCRLVAIDMLDTSQARMLEFKKAMEDQGWKERFAARVHGLAGVATVLARIRRLAAMREELAAMRARFEREQQYGPPEYGVPVSQEEIDAMASEIAMAEADAPREEELAILLELAAGQEPVLALLTIREGRTVATLEQAIAMAPEDPETLAAMVRAGLDFLIGKTWEAQADLSRSDSDAYKLQIVQEEANRQLGPWFKADITLAEDIGHLLSQGLVEWLGLGALLLALTFVFPPLGIALSAAFSVYSATTSVRQAIRLERLSRVRLAQYGFRALVSEEELAAAVQQAVLDVLFAAIDVAMAAGAAVKGLRALARGAAARRATAAALRLSLEPLAARLRTLAEWPAELRGAVRAGLVRELERQGVADSARLADELLGPVQRELAARYEAHLGEIADNFARELEANAELARDPEALRRWLAAQRLSPDEFVNRVLSEELSAGRALFDRTVARRLAGQPLLVQELALLPGPEELLAVQRELGELAATLRPTRLLALREAAGLRGLTYTEVAERLRLILRRVDAPEAALARLEWLLPGRPDAAELLDALAASANPRSALERLTPELLNATARGEIANLVESLARPGARAPVARALVVSAEERAAALARLEELAAARTVRGPLTQQAERLQRVRALIQAHPEGERILAEIADATAREGTEVTSAILEGLAMLPEGPRPSELEAVAGYLRAGGDARTMASVVGRATTQPGLRGYVRGFLERLPTMTDRELRGVAVVVAERGYGLAGGEAVLYINNWFRQDARAIFETLAELGPHSENLRYVIGYLRSESEGLRMAGSGHLLAARNLLTELGDVRLRFEAPTTIGPRRVLDIQVLSAAGETLLEVEVKEVTGILYAVGEQAESELVRDVIRSVHRAAPGEAPLARLRWMVRRSELVRLYGSEDRARQELLRRMLRAFDPERNPALRALEREALDAARRDFADNSRRILQLF
jgi:hypothetical protein